MANDACAVAWMPRAPRSLNKPRSYTFSRNPAPKVSETSRMAAITRLSKRVRTSTTQQTAPQKVNNSKFQVTHPFHPLYGRQFEEEGRPSRWGEERVWFRSGRNGARRTIPLRFTSLAAP